MNCWEFKKCDKKDCIAYTFKEADGFLEGKNGGRACMYLTGTFCAGQVQGTAKDKEKECGKCDFYLYLKGKFPSQVSAIKFGDFLRNKKSDNSLKLTDVKI